MYGKTKAEATRKLKTLIYDMDRLRNLCGPHRGLLFGDWLDIWLNDYKQNNIKATTFDSYYRNIETHIKPTLGWFDLLSLRTEHIQYLINELAHSKKLSPWSIIKVKNVINGALKQAVRCRYILHNPMEGVQVPSLREAEIQVMNREEQSAFLNAIQDEKLGILFLCALATGMRRGELLALTWDCVDFSAKEITVKSSMTYIYNNKAGINGAVCSTPKSKSGFRIIPMVPALIDSLQQHNVEQAKAKENVGSKWMEHNLVFPSITGTHLQAYRVLNGLRTACAKARIRYYNFHALRHTAATRMLEQGVQIKVVQTILGHADVSLTMNTYMHVFDTTVHKEMARMNELFFPQFTSRPAV